MCAECVDMGPLASPPESPTVPFPPPPTPVDPPECFICTETVPVPWRSDCGCVDRHMHGVCFLAMLKTLPTATCPVCTCKYKNVVVQTQKRVNLQGPAMLTFCVVCALLVVGACAVCTWLGLLRPNRTRRAFEVIVSAGTILTVVFCAVCVYTFICVRRNGVRYIMSTTHKKCHMYLVSPPVAV